MMLALRRATGCRAMCAGGSVLALANGRYLPIRLNGTPIVTSTSFCSRFW
jgi:hypothetical protein